MFTRTLSFTAFLLLGACSLSANNISERDIANLQDSAGAIWQSDGYGYILDTRSGQAVYNQVGGLCAPIGSEQENPMTYFDRFKVNDAKSDLSLFSKVDPYAISFKKIDALPTACAEDSNSAGPLEIFDAFAATYETHYAFFDVHGVDWQAKTKAARARLSGTSGEGELVGTFIGLLSGLRDGHVSISATVDGDEGQFIAYPGKTNEAIQNADAGGKSPNAAFGNQYLRADIEQSILGGHGFNALNERIKYGITSGDIGYIAVMAEGGYAQGDEPSMKEEMAALQPAMDFIIETFNRADVKAVVVDLSVNHGGYDFLGRSIAGRFTDTKVLAYTKYAYDADNKTPYEFNITPANGARYTGPVYVMTSDMTVSAGEVLTLSLRALPNVTHVGTPTRGAFSDVLTKYLPNGWEVTLSNEVYTDHEGNVWEGRGIEPQITMQVFDPTNPLTGHMPAISKLVKLIDERHSKNPS